MSDGHKLDVTAPTAVLVVVVGRVRKGVGGCDVVKRREGQREEWKCELCLRLVAEPESAVRNEQYGESVID